MLANITPHWKTTDSKKKKINYKTLIFVLSAHQSVNGVLAFWSSLSIVIFALNGSQLFERNRFYFQPAFLRWNCPFPAPCVRHFLPFLLDATRACQRDAKQGHRRVCPYPGDPHLSSLFPSTVLVPGYLLFSSGHPMTMPLLGKKSLFWTSLPLHIKEEKTESL